MKVIGFTFLRGNSSQSPKANVAACPGITTRHLVLFLWMLWKFTSLKCPSSLGPSKRVESSCIAPLRYNKQKIYKSALKA